MTKITSQKRSLKRKVTIRTAEQNLVAPSAFLLAVIRRLVPTVYTGVLDMYATDTHPPLKRKRIVTSCSECHRRKQKVYQKLVPNTL